MKKKSRILWHSIPSAMIITELPQNVLLLSITAKSERGSFHSKVIQKQLYQKKKKKKGRLMIPSVLLTMLKMKSMRQHSS